MNPSITSGKTTIVWFRKDLRIQDNPAFWHAAQQGNVIPVFIWSPEEEAYHHKADASLCWLHHSLLDLNHQLEQLGGNLVLRKGSSLSILREIMRETNADALFFNERYEPAIRDRDATLQSVLGEEGIEVQSFHSHLLFEPQSVTSQQNTPYKIYTPFWKQCINIRIDVPLGHPTAPALSSANVRTIPLEEMELLPNQSWHQKIMSDWTPGETGAKQQWSRFLNEYVSDYQVNRDFPYAKAVSRISPHLAWGEISPKWMWQSLMEIEEIEHSTEAFRRQLIWREFSYHQLIHFPHIIDRPMRSPFYAFPWEDNMTNLSLWKKGLTGYPLVDAGMRELWETGYMHNRVRMVAASFLVKHLLISWTHGASWFAETLLDYDVANNALGWQWVTGCGIDAAPYFRIFNPVKQGESFDSEGDYIRQWVPELSALPARYIHQPWKAPEHILQSSGITLGINYPYPIVDHEFARQRALSAFESIKNHGEMNGFHRTYGAL